MMATSDAQYDLLPDPDHTAVLKISLANLDSERKGNHTDDPELWKNRTWVSPPRLYCLHIERHPGLPADFNPDRLRGWDKGNIIIGLAEEKRRPLFQAWKELMETRFGQKRTVPDVIHLASED